MPECGAVRPGNALRLSLKHRTSISRAIKDKLNTGERPGVRESRAEWGEEGETETHHGSSPRTKGQTQQAGRGAQD